MKKQLFQSVYLWVFLLMGSTIFAQSISGTVSDTNGPLAGASVIIKGTDDGTVTDFDGNFSLDDVPSNAILVVSYVGYSAQELSVQGKSTINVILLEDISGLEEVVVIGYGAKEKSLVTGAISTIDSDQIQSSSNQRVEQVLQGRTSGVSVVSSSGSPGAAAKVRIRGTGSNGNSDPLYIVDGMKVSAIDNIAPNDIESIEVLKDAASSAIYGTQGANGVIIISTKRGKEGHSIISYNTQLASQMVRSKMKLMDASQFVNYMQEAGQTGVVDNGINTNWIDETFNDAFMQRHDLSFSGGSENISYYLSGSFLDQNGIVGKDNSAYSRATLRANIVSDVAEWLEVGVNISYTNTQQSTITEDDSYRGVINNMLLIDPLTPVIYTGELPEKAQNGVNNGTAMYDSKGNVYGYPAYSTGEVINPVAYANYIFNGDIDTDRMLSTVYGKFKLLENLSFTTRFGYERSNEIDSQWTPIYEVSSEASNPTATLSDNIRRNSRWLWENFAIYDQSFGDHNFTALLGYSAEHINNPYYSLNGANISYESDNFAYYDFSNRDNDRIGGSVYEKAMTSIFGRLSYDYAGKYLIEASLRSDTSSLFPVDNRTAVFPAISAGWVISKEGFWGEDAIINYFKIRGSWGQNGSDYNLDPRSPLQTFTVSASDGGQVTSVVYEGQTGVTPGDLPNENLSWEVSTQLDLGFDLRAFDNRFNFAFDYYDKTTEDLLIPASQSDVFATPSLGLTLPGINGGTVNNRGLEFEVGYNTTTKGGFSYGINLNLSTLKNEVTEVLGNAAINGATIPGGPTVTRFEEGYPLWYFYGYKTSGIDPQTGEPIIVDTDGVDGISATDKTMIGSPHPDVLYGGNFSMGYLGFDFNLMLQGVSGNEIFSAYHQPSRPITNKPVEYYNGRWTGPGDANATYPGASSINQAYDTDLMIQDGSYMRIKQIQLGYTLPLNVVEKIKLKRIRAYISLDDFFTITDYEGLDPESGSFTDNSQGVDRGFYPVAAKVIFGLSVDL
ncbi:SusC/RagA family TonB-linked outer membrane protein [Formosa haliotis]|uniref:SusC/RagA family TonB-linked outer membrane protein n=1 Tax=Formosa haliotis TaxID=1555194 RepID=UPI0008258469|nr:TonB-dependent receptor [Formosa haliotis]